MKIDVISSQFPLLTAMVALPAVVAVALWIIPGLRKIARELGVATALVVLGATVYALATFDYGHAGSYQFAETYSWVSSLGLSWALGVNGMGLSLVALSAVLVPIVLVADWYQETSVTSSQDGEAETTDNRWGYVALTLMSLAFMVLIFSARDVLLFYLTFEAMLIPIFFLIGRYGHGQERRQAAIKFLLYSLAGGLVMLIGVVALYVYALPLMQQGVTTIFTVETLAQYMNLPMNVQMWIFISFFIAFAIKAPMVPVHTWLPDTAAQARPGTSTLLVGVMDKIGTFGMISLCVVLFPQACHAAALPIVILAIISILWGALAALGQKDLLRLISFTSVSHFGLMVMAIFIGNETALMGAMIYMVAHGLSIAGLFLLAGFLRWRAGTQQVDGFGGMQRVTPVLAGTFLVCGLAAIALPGLSGFPAEFMVLMGTYRVAPWVAVLGIISVVLAAVYVLLPYQKIFTGPIRDHVKGLPDLTGREKWAVIAPLIILMVCLGLYPQAMVKMVAPVAQEITLEPMQNNSLSVKDTALSLEGYTHQALKAYITSERTAQ